MKEILKEVSEVDIIVDFEDGIGFAFMYELDGEYRSVMYNNYLYRDLIRDLKDNKLIVDELEQSGTYIYIQEIIY